MIPTVTFPAHTQARMDAAKAAKKPSELKKLAAGQPGPAVGPRDLPGEFMGLTVAARHSILQCNARVAIGHGTLDAFVPLINDVNLAMLEHYVPYIIANYKYRTPMGDIVLLPHNMNLVTTRGIKYVVNNMKRALEKGSYAIALFTKDKDDRTTSMIRPSRYPVDMIHALNTLKAFGLCKDADFLAMLDGPIMTSLELRAIEWKDDLWKLKRFLNTMSRELLVEEDRHLLIPAWSVYGERLRAESRYTTAGD